MYLITGGTGFVGTYLTRNLIERGDDVVLYDLHPNMEALEDVIGPQNITKVNVVGGDVTNLDQLEKVAKEYSVKMIIHLANPLPPISEEDPLRSLNLITLGHINTLEVTRRLGLKKLVWAGVTSVFGMPEKHGGSSLDLEVENDAPHFPDSLYGIYKSTNERICEFYRTNYEVNSVGLRLGQGYGAGKRNGRPFGIQLFKKVLSGEPYDVPNGDDIVNWQYVEDIADLFIMAIDAPPLKHLVFNTTGDVITMKETLKILHELYPNCKLNPLPGTCGILWKYNTSVLREEIGEFKVTPAREGFEKTLKNMQIYGDY